MTDAKRSLFCFGLGYVAEKLVDECQTLGWAVGGTVRSRGKADQFIARGISAEVFDGTDEIAPPPGADWVISVPPGAQGCPAFAGGGHGAATARSIIYLSTTGVYGDLNGGWVFEDSPLLPTSQRAERRMTAEHQWKSVRPDLAIVRLPGIYGPGRSVFDRLRAGKARRIIKSGQVFSRVHQSDIVSGLVALLAGNDTGGVYHFTDDAPAPPQDVIAFGAELLGKPIPPDIPFETADLSAMARSFYSECKRVSNAQTKARLGWRPALPTYQDGLTAILTAETC
ncbi:MAG: SDR family oxidoreductase [Pseudomonadota bacterium]